MATYEILIADDHPLFRCCTRRLRWSWAWMYAWLKQHAELETQLTDKTDWDLLLDLNMPGAYGSAWYCCAGNIRRFRW